MVCTSPSIVPHFSSSSFKKVCSDLHFEIYPSLYSILSLPFVKSSNPPAFSIICVLCVDSGWDLLCGAVLPYASESARDRVES